MPIVYATFVMSFSSIVPQFKKKKTLVHRLAYFKFSKSKKKIFKSDNLDDFY